MASEFFEHTTTIGDRWDLIALAYYGTATRIAPLLRANPVLVGDVNTPAPLVFKAGVIVRVPVLEDNAVDPATLPPWKR